MRVEPLGVDQGHASGSGHPTLVGAAAGLLLPLMIFLSRSSNLIGVRLTTGTSRTMKSITESKPGVANKLITTPERFLVPYLLPWQGR